MLLMPAQGPWSGGGRVNVVNSGKGERERVRVNVDNGRPWALGPPLLRSRFTVGQPFRTSRNYQL